MSDVNGVIFKSFRIFVKINLILFFTMKFFKLLLVMAFVAVNSVGALATKLINISAVDNEHLLLHFRDGEVWYRDNGTGASAYLGHSFALGDDSMRVFGQRLDVANLRTPTLWSVGSVDDEGFGMVAPARVWLKSKPMNTDSRLTSELDHWVFLKLPKPMKQGKSYNVHINNLLGSDVDTCSLKFDVRNSPSEAIHVNTIGYTPSQSRCHADLYLWMGDGGARDYAQFEGRKAWLYNLATGEKHEIGEVKPWKEVVASKHEAGNRNLTGSGVWTVDFPAPAPGRYRLVVEDVGCSMDFDVASDIYREPFKYSVRGYYYMRLGEPVDTPRVVPIPRQPRFVAGEDPAGFKIYKTDLHPWHPEWRKIGGDVWDEPHFKMPEQSKFWEHRLPGNPEVTGVKGGHSDAMDWDRHLAHVSNIYDMLLPYVLTGGKSLNDDNLDIRESGNGIPDLLDEARNEVDFFLSIRDGEAYSQGVTNPSADWKVMFQAGCTTIAAWANAANCAMMAEAFRLNGNKALAKYYANEAIKAFRYAEKQDDADADVVQHLGDVAMSQRDFKNMAAAYLYNVTGQREWEDVMAETSVVADGPVPLFNQPEFRSEEQPYCQLWSAAAYLTSPRKRHYGKILSNIKEAVDSHTDSIHLNPAEQRPSRRAAADKRHRTSENLQLAMLAHSFATDKARRDRLEDAMYAEASWGLGRNPSNTVEMTGLRQRHITDVYSTGRNDGVPGTHPGQTPFNGVETWSPDNGGDARILVNRCYPAWEQWPQQESFFNQRYLWVNAEFTPRETMRGKMALLAYLYALDSHRRSRR